MKISNKEESRKEEAIFLCLVRGWVVSAWIGREPGLRARGMRPGKPAGILGSTGTSRLPSPELPKPAGCNSTAFPRINSHSWGFVAALPWSWAGLFPSYSQFYLNLCPNQHQQRCQQHLGILGMGIPSSKGLNPTWSCWAGRDKHQELKFPPEPTWTGRKLEGVIQGQPGWTLLIYGINSSPGSATGSQNWGAAKPRALHSLFFPRKRTKVRKNSHFCHQSEPNPTCLGWALGYPGGKQNSCTNICF